MEHNENKAFTYTYSAKEQEEVKRIRKKYEAPTPSEDKMARLRRLDARVTQRAQAGSLVFGVLGTLFLGLGMSLVMTDIGSALGAYRAFAMPFGILIGMLGILAVAAAYPIYNRITKKERERVAPEILRLTDELMK